MRKLKQIAAELAVQNEWMNACPFAGKDGDAIYSVFATAQQKVIEEAKEAAKAEGSEWYPEIERHAEDGYIPKGYMFAEDFWRAVARYEQK